MSKVTFEEIRTATGDPGRTELMKSSMTWWCSTSERNGTGPFLVVSADIHTGFDYASLLPRAQAMARDSASPRAHLVMVPTSPRHPSGDFVLADGMLRLEGGEKLVYGNIALHDTALFGELCPRTRIKLLPLWLQWISRGWVSGERYEGAWINVGTPEDLAQLESGLRHGDAPTH